MAIQKVTLKAEIEKQLEEKKTLSSADLEAVMTKHQEPIAEPVKGEQETSKVTTDSIETDPLIKEGLARKDYTKELELNPTAFSELDIEADELLEITPKDKRVFLDALVEGKRFTRNFELYGGAITGTFRARTTEESCAVIKEMTRQARSNPMLIEEYSCKMRHALLHCQMSQYRGVERKEWSGDLSAVEVIEGKEVKVKAPKWYSDMEIVFAGKDEGVTISIYNELRKFEKIYWTLIRNASDQNFWRPEASSIV